MKSLVRSMAMIVVTGVLVAGLAAVASARPAPDDPSAPSVSALPAPDPGMPCKTSIVRAQNGKQLKLGLSCAGSEVVIARFDLGAKAKWIGQRPFAGSTCNGRGTTIWNCVFPGGIAAGKSLSGSLTFQKPRPATKQSVRVTLFAGSLFDIAPGKTAVFGY